MARYTVGAGIITIMGRYANSLPKYGDRILVRTCSDPQWLHEGIVDHVYRNGAIDTEAEDPLNLGHGGYPVGTCAQGKCPSKTCGWYPDNTVIPWNWTPRWSQPAGPPTVPVPPPGPPATVASATAILKSVWGPTPKQMANLTPPKPIMCVGKHCIDPHAPYADGPNQPDGTFRCYSCRQGIMR